MSSRARRKTASSIGSVSLPVNVFCWLGWKQPRIVARGSAPRRGGRSAGAAGSSTPASRSADHSASYPNAPSVTITLTRSSSASSRSRYGRQRSRSSGVGLFAGGAPHRRGDVGVAQLEPVVARDGGGLVRVPDSVQRRVEPVARTVAREHPPGPVGAVRGRRQADDEQPGAGVAEARHRAPPVLLVAERGALRARDLLAPRDESRAGAASVISAFSRARESEGMPLACLVVRVLLIVNTTASSVTARKRVVIQKALGGSRPRDDGDVAPGPRRPARPGRGPPGRRGRRGARRRRHAERGGRRPRRHRDRARALPGGSTNVYARTLGIAHDPVDATAQLLGSLERRSFQRIGLGQVNGRYFLFHSGVGFDAAVVSWVERHSAIKRYAGAPALRRRVVRHLAAHLRPLARPVRRDARFGRGDRGRDAHDRVEDEPVHLPRQPAARRRAGRRAGHSAERHGGQGPPRAVDADARRRGAALARDAAPASERRASRRRDRRPRSPASSRSRTRSTATTSVRSTGSTSATSRTSSPSSCRRRRLAASRAERVPRDPGGVRDDAVDSDARRAGRSPPGRSPSRRSARSRARRPAPRPPPRTPRPARPRGDAAPDGRARARSRAPASGSGSTTTR